MEEVQDDINTALLYQSPLEKGKARFTAVGLCSVLAGAASFQVIGNEQLPNRLCPARMQWPLPEPE